MVGKEQRIRIGLSRGLEEVHELGQLSVRETCP